MCDVAAVEIRHAAHNFRHDPDELGVGEFERLSSISNDDRSDKVGYMGVLVGGQDKLNARARLLCSNGPGPHHRNIPSPAQ